MSVAAPAPLRRGRYLRLAAGLVLALGLGLAAGLFATAAPEAPAQGYSLEGGQSFETSPWDTRSFRRGLETIGGKQALFFTQLREDMADFLRGRGLALAVGLGALVVSGGLFWLAGEAEKDAPGS